MPTTSKLASAVPPSRKGKYSQGTDGRVSQRCICCELEGDAVPKKKGTNTKLIGLEMLGHPGPDPGKGDDIRFAPWEEREIGWVEKKSKTKMNVNWPEGTGPMCHVCAQKCRTLPCGAVLPVQHLESARRE